MYEYWNYIIRTTFCPFRTVKAKGTRSKKLKGQDEKLKGQDDKSLRDKIKKLKGQDEKS